MSARTSAFFDDRSVRTRTAVTGFALAAVLGLSALPPATPAAAAPRGGVERISTAADGTQLTAASGGGTLSADGRYAAYGTQGPGEGCPATFSTCAFVKDLRTGELEQVPGTGVYTGSVSISPDGRRVAYTTGSRFTKPYVYDRRTGRTEPLWPQEVPTGAHWELGDVGGFSADGDHVAYTLGNRNGNSGSPYLWVRDLTTGTDELITPQTPEGNVSGARLSGDGRFVAYGVRDGDRTPLYVKDRTTGTVRRVDTAPDGAPADGVSQLVQLSEDGRRVLFNSWATDLAPGGPVRPVEQAYLADLHTGRVRRVGAVGAVAHSADRDCRFVLLKEHGGEPPAQQGDLVLLDVRTGKQRLVAPAGASATTAAPGADVVARHGGQVVFGSAAEDLVPGDTNEVSDVFVRRLK
ncbi:TolB family protein [Streptomyces mexicanus]|uniref:TolB family protein n=1 Tax=Streptomyces mexicanus TaxID=178566 RepID=UPI001F22C846|nr:hypothetical protein [Streptomyces mexicanus]